MTTLPEISSLSELQISIDEFARAGARRMILAALDAEVQSYLDRFPERDDDGHGHVVRSRRPSELSHIK